MTNLITNLEQSLRTPSRYLLCLSCPAVREMVAECDVCFEVTACDCQSDFLVECMRLAIAALHTHTTKRVEVFASRTTDYAKVDAHLYIDDVDVLARYDSRRDRLTVQTVMQFDSITIEQVAGEESPLKSFLRKTAGAKVGEDKLYVFNYGLQPFVQALSKAEFMDWYKPYGGYDDYDEWRGAGGTIDNVFESEDKEEVAEEIKKCLWIEDEEERKDLLSELDAL